MNYTELRAWAKYALLNRAKLLSDWTTQGFGFLRLRLDDSTRLHVWDSRLRVPGVSDIHDHAQWHFESVILSGMLINVRLTIDEAGAPHHAAVIQCGQGGGMSAAAPDVGLVAEDPELYVPGDRYQQRSEEIHRTFASDGTVTLIRQVRCKTDSARVFWPRGSVWGDAFPRAATQREVEEVGAFALSVLG